MSRTWNKPIKGGYRKDWWGKRPLAGHCPSPNSGVNKKFKRILHKKERKISAREIIKNTEENKNEFSSNQ